MIERHVFCDRCRQPVLRNLSVLSVEAGPLRQRHDRIDLCEGCTDRLVELLGSPASLTPACSR